MAKKSRVYGFKASRKGEQAVANASAVQSMLAREAGYVEGNANAALGKNLCRVSPVQGRFAHGYVVSIALSKDGRRFDDADRREQILKDQVGG